LVTASAKRPAPIAVTVSDRTSLAVLGVPWRTLRTFLQERGIPIAKIGRRPVVRLDLVLAALGGETAAPVSTWSEDDVLALAASGKRGAR
jgi:hypothetical protein